MHIYTNYKKSTLQLNNRKCQERGLVSLYKSCQKVKYNGKLASDLIILNKSQFCALFWKGPVTWIGVSKGAC